MKIDRIEQSPVYQINLSGKSGIRARFIGVDDLGNVAVFDSPDRYLYRPPEVLEQRAKDRAAAKLDPDTPNYATNAELVELADFCIEQWAAFRAKVS